MGTENFGVVVGVFKNVNKEEQSSEIWVEGGGEGRGIKMNF